MQNSIKFNDAPTVNATYRHPLMFATYEYTNIGVT